jgi:hypothetical protein
MRWFPLFCIKLAFLSIQRRRRIAKEGKNERFIIDPVKARPAVNTFWTPGIYIVRFVSFLFILEIVLRGLKNWRGKKESADFALLYIITHFFHNLLTICSEP